MKETIQELAAGDTTTATTGISSVQGEEWGRDILEDAKRKMFFEQFAMVVDVPQGIRDWHLPIAAPNLDFEITTAEGVDRTLTQIDSLNTVTFTPSTRKLGVSVSRDVIRTSQVDVLRFARSQMVYDAAVNIDDSLAGSLRAVAPTRSGSGTEIFGGSAVDLSTLVAGDVLSPDLIAEAQSLLKQQNWMPEPDRPFVLFISAVSEEALLKDSQFVNAAEYGDQSIVLNGEIGRYLGVRVIVTENPQMAFADGGAGAALGHHNFLVKSMVSYGLAYGERPFLDSDYWKLGAEFRLFLDMTYDTQVLQQGAIVVITTLDA